MEFLNTEEGRRKALIATAAVFAVLLLVALLADGTESGGASDREQAASITTVTTDDAPPEPVPVVPDVVGRSAAQAQRVLAGEDLTARHAVRPLRANRCTVTWQRPRAGSPIGGRTRVRLRCQTSVPRMTGQRPNPAEARLQRLGFETRLVGVPTEFGLDRCRVRRQRPVGTAAPRSLVRLHLRCTPPPPPEPAPAPPPEPPPAPEPAPEPSATSGCDPNYTPCVPAYPPDLNCADTGPVTVTGSDPHRLDADGDGVACGGD
jgi:hypothetical protein